MMMMFFDPEDAGSKFIANAAIYRRCTLRQNPEHYPHHCEKLKFHRGWSVWEHGAEKNMKLEKTAQWEAFLFFVKYYDV
jgi:hypothetical protein